MERDEHMELSEGVCSALGTIGSPESVAALIVIAQYDPSAEDFIDVRASAMWALGRVGDQESVDFLTSIIDPGSHEPTELVVTAASALAMLGDQRAVEPLARIVDPDSGEAGELVATAASALGMLSNPRAIEPLGKALLSMSDQSHTAEIMDALHKFGLPAVPYLAKVYAGRERDEDERTAARSALAKIIGDTPINA